MSKKDHIIVGVHIHDRAKQALEIQRILGESGHIIHTRLGLHELDDKDSAAAGILILELIGKADEAEALIRQLRKCRGVQVKKMVFPHE